MPLLHTLLGGTIDYAGLFPPAELDMVTAADNYVAYRDSPDGWALGRFVVPVSRLPELEEYLRSRPPRSADRLPLAALLGASPAADVEALGQFHRRQAARGVAVEAIEAKAGSPEEVRTVLAGLPSDCNRYLEVAPGEALPRELDAVAAGRAFAKVRTGGTVAAAFPSPDALLHFLEEAARRRLPFKATAGLHHPLRGSYRLTYAPSASSGTMFGYLNVLLAAAVLWTGGGSAGARAALLEEDPGVLCLGDLSLRWRGLEFDAAALREVRASFFHGFGSCSFREPLDELAAWGWR